MSMNMKGDDADELSRHEGHNGSAPGREGRASKDLNREPRIQVICELDLEDIVPEYLASLKNNVEAIASALCKDDLGAIRMMGHDMSGSGAGFGFNQVSELGQSLERAAKQANRSEIEALMHSLADLTNRVDVIYA